MIAECRRELEHDGGDEQEDDEGVEGGWSGLGKRFSSSWSAGIGSLFRKGGVEGSGENVNCASRVLRHGIAFLFFPHNNSCL